MTSISTKLMAYLVIGSLSGSGILVTLMALAGVPIGICLLVLAALDAVIIGSVFALVRRRAFPPST